MYGFAPRTQKISVCFSCRLRLIAHTSSHGHATKLRFTSRSFHYGRAYEDRVTQDQNRRLRGDENSRPSDQDSTQNRSLLPQFRIRLGSGHERISLGVESLGEPASIRVMRDRKRHRRRAVDTSETAATENTTLSSDDLMHDFATQKRGRLSEKLPLDHVKNVDSIYTTWTEELKARGAPPAEQCRSLGQALHDGFTFNQLNHYLRKKTQTHPDVKPDNLEGWVRSKNYRRSRWYYGSSTFPETSLERLNKQPRMAPGMRDGFLLAPGPLDEKGLPTQTAKHAVVEAILRGVWQIRTLEETEGSGEIEFRISKSQHLKVLSMKGNGVLKKLSELYGVKINIHLPNRIVRFTGDYFMCLDAVSLFDKAVNEVAFAEVELPATADQGSLLDESFLEEIGEFTSTDVKLTKLRAGLQTAKVQIWYTGQDTKGVEDARRLIKQALEPSTPGDSKVLCHPGDGTFTPEVVPIPPGSTLPLHERKLDWSRCIDAHPRPDDHLLTAFIPRATLPVEREIVNDFLRLWEAKRPAVHTLGRDLGWQQEMQRPLSATIGHVVHGLERVPRTLSTLPQDLEPEQLYNLLLTRPRNIITTIPSIFPILERLIEGSPTMQDSLCLTFRPEKILSSDPLVPPSCLPSLELRLAVDKAARRTTLASAHLVRDSLTSDLLQPSQGTDVRFQARNCIAADLHNVDPAIQRFIDDSDLNIWDAGQAPLRVRPNVSFAVPMSACRMPELAGSKVRDQKRGWVNGQKEDAAVNADFEFVRMEYRSEMTVPTDLGDGWRVVYATIEGGRARGTRTELLLRADAPGDEDRKQWTGRLVRRARDLAGMVPR